MKKNLPLLPVMTGCLLLLSGCGAPVGLAAWTGGTAYLTKPGDPPPADTDDQIPAHESWCYSTMGEQVECFTTPQATPPGRLVNVDPPSKYPLNATAYANAIEQARIAALPPPPPTPPPADVSLIPPPVVAAPIVMPPPVLDVPKPVKKHKAKKHPKKPAKPIDRTTPPIPNPPNTPAINP